MTHITAENNHPWRNGAWVAIVGLGLFLSACGTSPARSSDCNEGPQMLETTAPWGQSCDQASHHEPFEQMEFRHDSPSGT